MTSNTIPKPTPEQEFNDLAIAHAQLRTARIRQHRITEDAKALDPAGYRGNVSVYLANVDVATAESILNNLIEYYRHLDLASNTTTNSISSTAADRPLTNLGVFEVEDSDDDEHDGHSSSPGPAPAYSSWPSTPLHFYAVLAEEGEGQQQPLPVPTTPPRQSQLDGASSHLLSPFLSPPPSTQPRVQAPATPSTPRHVASQTTTGVVGAASLAFLDPPPSTQPRIQAPATPSTPRHVASQTTTGIVGAASLAFSNPPPSTQPPSTPRHVASQSTTIVGEGGVLTSSDPKKKHYIVTCGRRTGIYGTWAEVRAYTKGLGSEANWQGFTTYKAAFQAYMRARECSMLRVIRLPTDTEEDWGPLHASEDL